MRWRSAPATGWRSALPARNRPGGRAGGCAGGLLVAFTSLRTELAVTAALATAATTAVFRTRSDHGFAREIDAALAVDLEHLDLHAVADVEHVFHLRDTFRRELADVDQTF